MKNKNNNYIFVIEVATLYIAELRLQTKNSKSSLNEPNRKPQIKKKKKSIFSAKFPKIWQLYKNKFKETKMKL